MDALTYENALRHLGFCVSWYVIENDSVGVSRGIAFCEKYLSHEDNLKVKAYCLEFRKNIPSSIEIDTWTDSLAFWVSSRPDFAEIFEEWVKILPPIALWKNH